MKIIKNQAKKLKEYGKNVYFHRHPLKEYSLYTRENVDIYGWPLSVFVTVMVFNPE